MTADPGSPEARSYLLFDIDGTLMEAEGAGRAALDRAYDEVTGVPGAMDGVVFAGRTDHWIVSEVERTSGARQPLLIAVVGRHAVGANVHYYTEMI